MSRREIHRPKVIPSACRGVPCSVQPEDSQWALKVGSPNSAATAIATALRVRVATRAVHKQPHFLDPSVSGLGWCANDTSKGNSTEQC